MPSLPDEKDDRKLCAGVFSRILAFHGDDVSVAELSHPERTVVCAWHARVMIAQGGLRYLFEGSSRGDPGFVYTAAAFRVIGSPATAEVFERALGFFPDRRPPANLKYRMDAYQSAPEEVREACDRAFGEAQADLEAKLAAFIRRNAEAFEDL